MSLGLNLGVARKATIIREPPPIPPTSWRAPTEYPDLRDAVLMAFDTETKEFDFGHGPGWARGAGHMVGFSLAAMSREGYVWSAYVPLRHEVCPHQNVAAEPALRWAKDMLESAVPKTGANLMFDIGYMGEEGINVNGPFYDTQFAEALLDETGHTNLEYLAQKYLGQGKESNLLYEWCARAYGGTAGPKQRANIWRAPPSLVGHYAESDVRLPLSILPLQWQLLAGEELLDLYQMECRLVPLLIAMRRTGVQIDMPYAHRLYGELGEDLINKWNAFGEKYGIRANYNSAKELAPIFDSIGVKFLRTEGGAPSFTKDWLTNLDNPIGAEINELRELEKLKNTFVKSYLLESNVKGRIHCTFHPLRADKSGGESGTAGTKTGRFSSGEPNLQNIPVRSETGLKIRRAFVKDPHHLRLRKYDYSQIEYRMLAHFASDAGDGSADRLRDSYINNPDVDYHDIVYDNVCPYMGWDPLDKALRKFKRRQIKNTNFGLLYGQGQGKLARTMGFDAAQARQFFTSYHTGAPYVKPTMEACAQEVHRFGFVRTILGRRTRFNTWSPFEWDRSEDPPLPLAYEHALAKWGSNIQRAYSYRAVNYKFQGSAADMMKVAMVTMWESGVFNVTGVPKLTVHDELLFSETEASPAVNEAFRYMQNLMETAIKLHVPVRADPDAGLNWADCKEMEKLAS